MLLTKNVLLMALVLMVATGCVNNQAKQQQAQIITLQSEVVTAQQANLDAQQKLLHSKEELLQIKADLTSKLDSANSALLKRKAEVNELTALLSATQSKLAAQKLEAKKPESKPLGNKMTLGQREWVYVSALKDNLKTRVDTGAKTSSISATDITHFERDGEKWVRFNLIDEEDAAPLPIEAKVVRTVKIIQSSDPDNTQSRVVVNLHVRLGKIVGEAEFTLTDRRHMEHPILIGRSFLQDLAIVDVSKEYLQPKYVDSNEPKK